MLISPHSPGVVETCCCGQSRPSSRISAHHPVVYSLLVPLPALAQVTAVHKANIMKKADGIFLESCAEVAKVSYSGPWSSCRGAALA